jgi:hypothetical protein
MRKSLLSLGLTALVGLFSLTAMPGCSDANKPRAGEHEIFPIGIGRIDADKKLDYIVKGRDSSDQKSYEIQWYSGTDVRISGNEESSDSLRYFTKINAKDPEFKIQIPVLNSNPGYSRSIHVFPKDNYRYVGVWDRLKFEDRFKQYLVYSAPGWTNPKNQPNIEPQK